MPRYIDADKLVAERTIFMQDEEAFDVSVVLVSDIKLAPTADVAEVKHGEWRKSGPLLECQNCGEIYSQLGGNSDKDWNYCPSCGAKMGGKDDEK